VLTHIGSLVVFAVVALALPALAIGLLLLEDPAIRFRRPAVLNGDTRGSVIRAVAETLIRLRPQHYWYGVAAVVLQVAALFLYPWVLVTGGLGTFALVEATIFAVILLVGLGYARRANVLLRERPPSAEGS